MNNDITNKIKSSLENYEVPYDANAWNDMSKRLDNHQATSGNKFLSSPKTWIVVSVVVLGASLSIYKLSNSTVKPTTIAKSNSVNSIPQENTKNIQIIENKSTQKVETKKTKSVQNTTTPSRLENQKQPGSSVSMNNNINENTTSKQAPSTKINERYTKNFILPKTNKTYCIGEKVEIFNPNQTELSLFFSNGKQIKIDGQESILVTLKQDGQYLWNGEKIAFEVKEKPTVNFSLPSDIIYEEGIPTINLSSDLNAKAQKWIFDQRVISTNENVRLHIFNNEKYSITLSIVGTNGCENQLTKTFYPDPDFHYNLKAPSGFEPLSTNSKRNTFLPLALLERDTPFKMLIIDPKDGKVIFETTDKNNPWDGKNQHTDQLVPEGSEYIWKVTLMNPEKYEKNEYRGTITRK